MLQHMLPLYIQKIYLCTTTIKNIKTFMILPKDKTAQNNSMKDEPLQ